MLTPEEKKIAEYGISQGKSKEEVSSALSKYRSSQSTPQTSEPAQTTKSAPLGERLANVGNSAYDSIKSKIQGTGENANQSPIRRGVEATATAFGTVPQGAKEFLPEFARKGLDFVGDTIGTGFRAVAGAIGDTNLFKGAAGNQVTRPDGTTEYKANDTQGLEDALGTASGGGEIAGNILGGKGAAGTMQKTVNVANKVGPALNTAKNAIKTSLNPTAEQIAKERLAKMTKGFEEQNTRLKSADKAFTKNTKVYKTTGGGTRTVTPIDTFAKHGVAPVIEKGSIQMGDYRTGVGELGKIRAKVSQLDNEIEAQMKGNTTPISLDEMEFKAFENVMKNEDFRLSGTVGANVAKLEAKFKDFKNTYGDTITADEVNKMRKNANYDFDPETQDISRIIGDAAREYVYRANPKAKGLLQEQGDLLAARKYAEAINGTKVTGGRLGNMAMRTAGAIAGSTVKDLPVVGPVLGMLGGEFAARALQQAQFKSLWTELRAKLVKDGQI